MLEVARAQFSETYASLLAAYVASPGGPTDGTMTPRTAQRNLPPPSVDGSFTVPSFESSSSLSAPATSSDARDALANLLKKPRSSALDFSTLTPGPKGTTIVHEAARRKDVEMLKLCAARGASMVVRDRRGKMPLDAAGVKDENVRSLLRQGATSEGRALRNSASLASGVSALGSLSSAMAGSPSQQGVAAGPAAGPAIQPAMKGYLSKWTNMARGYRTRWFVLQNGHISYYRDAEEEGHASRGTISAAVAIVEHSSGSSSSAAAAAAGAGERASAGDKTGFTIGTKLGKSPKWYLKGNHPVETMQWVQALRASIEYANAGTGASGWESSASPNNLGLGVSTLSGSSKATRTSSAGTSTSSLLAPGGGGGGGARGGPGSVASGSTAAVALATPGQSHGGFPRLDRTHTSRTTRSALSEFDNPNTRSPSPQLTEGSVYGDAGTDTEGGVAGGPHADNFE